MTEISITRMWYSLSFVSTHFLWSTLVIPIVYLSLTDHNLVKLENPLIPVVIYKEIRKHNFGSSKTSLWAARFLFWGSKVIKRTHAKCANVWERPESTFIFAQQVSAPDGLWVETPGSRQIVRVLDSRAVIFMLTDWLTYWLSDMMRIPRRWSLWKPARPGQKTLTAVDKWSKVIREVVIDLFYRKPVRS